MLRCAASYHAVFQTSPLSEEAKLLEGVHADSLSGASLDCVPPGGGHLVDDDPPQAVGKGGDPVGPDPPAGDRGAHNGIARCDDEHQHTQCTCRHDTESGKAKEGFVLLGISNEKSPKMEWTRLLWGVGGGEAPSGQGKTSHTGP